MNKQNFSFKSLNKNWNIKALFQGILVGFIYGFFLFVGFLYAGLGMSPKYGSVMAFITNIPMYPVDIVRKIFSLPSLIEQDEMRMVINMISVWLVFYFISLIFKVHIKTLKLIFLSIVIGMGALFLIDLLIGFK